MKRALAGCLLFVAAVSGCGSSSSSKPDGGGAGKDGGAGTTGTAGTGGAGTTGSAGTGGAGTTGSAGADGGAGTTGSAGTDGGAGTTGSAGTDGGAGVDGGGSDAPDANDGGADLASDTVSDTVSDAPASTCASPTSTDLVSTAGSSVGNQGFAEMRVLEITASGDAAVTALVLDGYAPGVDGTLGARIYDAASHALVASGSKAVTAGTGLTVEIPVSATLTAGKAYRVGFIGSTGGNGELFQPTSKPYTAGAFQVTGVFQSNDDTFPENVNIYAPRLTIKACVAAADGGTGDAAGDGAGACNALDVTGAAIAKTSHAGAAPAMTGGTITAGTYLLTAMDKYNNTQGSNTHRETWVFTAGHVEAATQDSDDGNVVQRYSANYTTTGTNGISLTFTCPAALAGMVKTAQFTATANTIQTLGEPSSSDQEIHTLTRQQ